MNDQTNHNLDTTAQQSSDAAEPSATMTFQQAMNRLQQIVNMLSNPNLELEAAMSLFQEGLTLSRQCEGQLKHFEEQMNTLMQDNGLGGAGQ